ncbi:MAG: dTDP-glucose 4,6-dehydratase [Anaerolineales bacterium]|nr:dTDP-glucose 4,6-dehydratase [Anaerolineales bacterium]
MKNVLITGGAGFIGSNFIHYLLKAEPHISIVNLDALTYAASVDNLKNLPDLSRYIFVEGDIRDRTLIEDLLRKYTIDTIVHFAAESHVDRSILGPELFLQTNIMGTFTLLDAAKRFWLEEQSVPKAEIRFHHISTDEVFGSLSSTDPAFSETTPYAPNSPYAASKASSDHLVRAYAHTYNLPVTITNCSNNYGPRQFPEKLIPLIILNAFSGKDLPVYGDGQQIRDWLFVDDHCAAIHVVLKHGVIGETYNIGGNNQPTNLSIVETICDLLDELVPDQHVPRRKLIKFVKDRPGHDRRYAINIGKVNADLGWAPKYSLNEGLRETIQWYLDHLEWARSVHEKRDYQKWISQNYTERDGKQ